jgi:hypothetical protein
MCAERDQLKKEQPFKPKSSAAGVGDDLQVVRPQRPQPSPDKAFAEVWRLACREGVLLARPGNYCLDRRVRRL